MKSRDQRLPYVWIGLMVLMAHLVDVVEWFTVVLVPGWRNGHYLTHSPLYTGILAGIICAGVAIVAKVRRPFVFLLIVLTVLSHLLLDWYGGRKALADAAGVLEETEIGKDGFPLRQMIVAEIWLFGLLLIEVLLWRAASDKRCPTLGRSTAGFLAAVAVIAAGTRIAAVWGLVYAICSAHAALLLRRDLTWRLAWGLVPLIPLGICLCGELYSSHLVATARDRMMAGEYRQAISLYERSLRFPARASRVSIFVNIGQCYEYMKEPLLAEATFLKAIHADDTPNAGQYWLAWLYANQNWRGTPMYRPDEAARLLRELINSSIRPRVKQLSVDLLAELERRGHLADPAK
ncbi:MAG: tetratricopeptide repeat protein [Planctomycetes bacterium]|nr:tetratricopeptide repeat protein [Planctomycetota bacterium]